MMTRKECYDFIKKHNLSDEVKNKFGRHYTNVTTENLLNYVAPKATLFFNSFTAKKATKKTTKEDCMCDTIRSKFAKLVEILGKHRILLPSEIDDICKS